MNVVNFGLIFQLDYYIIHQTNVYIATSTIASTSSINNSIEAATGGVLWEMVFLEISQN